MNKTFKIAAIPGDGVGPEVTSAAVEVLSSLELPLEFQEYEAGDLCLENQGVALPDKTLLGALDADAVLFGAAGNSAAEVILRLRKELGTFVNLRPTRAYPGVECLYPEADFVIVRENTECLYCGIEEEISPGVVHATRVITQQASEKIARFAFNYAKQNGLEKVTSIHKSNVLKKSDGLFTKCTSEVSKEFPNIEYEEILVDAAAMYLVQDPSRFQVLVTPNLYGDILSDLGAGLIGGLGLSPSANLGESHALFEPVHGTAPDIAGQNKANPTAAILCGAMMLRHLGHADRATEIESVLEKLLAEGETTADLGGSLSTTEMSQAVIKELRVGVPS